MIKLKVMLLTESDVAEMLTIVVKQSGHEVVKRNTDPSHVDVIVSDRWVVPSSDLVMYFYLLAAYADLIELMDRNEIEEFPQNITGYQNAYYIGFAMVEALRALSCRQGPFKDLPISIS